MENKRTIAALTVALPKGVFITDCDEGEISDEIALQKWGISVIRTEPNNHLIDAAPELLESLIEVVRISDRKHDAWDKAKAAIAKAKNL